MASYSDIWSITLGYDIVLSQREADAFQGHYPDDFRVTYGMQVKSGLTYAKAAQELGQCIMHALAIEGHLDSETDSDD